MITRYHFFRKQISLWLFITLAPLSFAQIYFVDNQAGFDTSISGYDSGIYNFENETLTISDDITPGYTFLDAFGMQMHINSNSLLRRVPISGVGTTPYEGNFEVLQHPDQTVTLTFSFSHAITAFGIAIGDMFDQSGDSNYTITTNTGLTILNVTDPGEAALPTPGQGTAVTTVPTGETFTAGDGAYTYFGVSEADPFTVVTLVLTHLNGVNSDFFTFDRIAVARAVVPTLSIIDEMVMPSVNHLGLRDLMAHLDQRHYRRQCHICGHRKRGEWCYCWDRREDRCSTHKRCEHSDHDCCKKENENRCLCTFFTERKHFSSAEYDNLDYQNGGRYYPGSKILDDYTKWNAYGYLHTYQEDIEGFGLTLNNIHIPFVPDYKMQIHGGTVGIDYDYDNRWILGMALIGSTGKVDLKNTGRVNIDGLSIAPYISFYDENAFGDNNDIYADLIYSYGMYENELLRYHRLGSTAGTADVTSKTLTFNLGLNLYRGNWIHTPFASATYSEFDQDAYTETGAFPLSYQASSHDSLKTRVGYRLARLIGTNSGRFRATAHVAWDYEHRSKPDTLVGYYLSQPDPNRYVAGASLAYFFNNDTFTRIGYEFGFSEDIQSHFLNLGLEIRW